MTTAARPYPKPEARTPRVADGLVGLVRRLAQAGQQLLDTLRRGNTGYPTLSIAERFGTLSIAMIIARLTRGLLIAQALEARLLRRRGPQAERRVMGGAVARAGRAAVTRRPPIDEEAELRGPLPSAQEIAARIRRQPLGTVIAELCRDLGITTAHPEWQDIKKAIIFNGGNLVRLLMHWLRPTREAVAIAIWAEAAGPTDRPLLPRAHPP